MWNARQRYFKKSSKCVNILFVKSEDNLQHNFILCSTSWLFHYLDLGYTTTRTQHYNNTYTVSLGFSDVDYYNVCFIGHRFFFCFLYFSSDSLISDRSTPTLAQDVSSIQGNPGDKDTCPRCGGMVRTVL